MQEGTSSGKFFVEMEAVVEEFAKFIGDRGATLGKLWTKCKTTQFESPAANLTALLSTILFRPFDFVLMDRCFCLFGELRDLYVPINEVVETWECVERMAENFADYFKQQIRVRNIGSIDEISVTYKVFRFNHVLERTIDRHAIILAMISSSFDNIDDPVTSPYGRQLFVVWRSALGNVLKNEKATEQTASFFLDAMNLCRMLFGKN